MINGKVIHVKQNTGQRQRSAWALKRLVKGQTQADCNGLSMLSIFKLEVFTCSKYGLKRQSKTSQRSNQSYQDSSGSGAYNFFIPLSFNLLEQYLHYFAISLLCLALGLFPCIILVCELMFSEALSFLPNLILQAPPSLPT